MSIEIKMPALSPTMEEGTLAKWLVKEGDSVKSGDLMAEIETDKATMEFEAVDEGVIAQDPGGRGHRQREGRRRDRDPCRRGRGCLVRRARRRAGAKSRSAQGRGEGRRPGRPRRPTQKPAPSAPAAPAASGDRVKASPLARRIAADKGIDLACVERLGPERAHRQGGRRRREAGRCARAAGRGCRAAVLRLPPPLRPPRPRRCGSTNHPARGREAVATSARRSRAA